MKKSTQTCGICQKHIEQNRVTYRCGDMETCSPECNVKRLEYIYIIDPSLSSPVKWKTNNTVLFRERWETKVSREEACSPEMHHPYGTIHSEHFNEEKVKPWRDIPSLKYCALAIFVPISVLLYKILFSVVI
jgi:hypothetical protein